MNTYINAVIQQITVTATSTVVRRVQAIYTLIVSTHDTSAECGVWMCDPMYGSPHNRDLSTVGLCTIHIYTYIGPIGVGSTNIPTVTFTAYSHVD